MTLIEAVKTGKRIRRNGDGHWCDVGSNLFHRGGSRYYFTKEDVLAEDWEIEEKKVEITKEQFLSAFTSARLTFENEKYGFSTNLAIKDFRKYLIKELGFED